MFFEKEDVTCLKNRNHRFRKDQAFNPFNNRTAIKLSLWISVLLNAIMMLGHLYDKTGRQPDVYSLIYMFVSNAVLFYLLFILNFYIIKQKTKRGYIIGYMVIVTVIVAVILSISFSKILFHFIHEPESLVNRYLIMSLIKDLIVVIIVHLTTLLLYSIQQRQVAVLENERLIAENIRIRYEVLKNQVDPHFLFNSLNTLDGLIGTDDDKAHEYVQHLSSVFRYAIGNKEVMHLSEELDFAGSFAHLMKIRYGDNFNIEYHIDEKYKSWFIMPVSIQLLIENAVKHNVISTKYPLLITIETTANDSIRVMNPIQLKKEAEQGEGIGLANLSERYDLLFQKEISITQTDVFCVEIPLIKQFEPAKTKLI